MGKLLVCSHLDSNEFLNFYRICRFSSRSLGTCFLTCFDLLLLCLYIFCMTFQEKWLEVLGCGVTKQEI